MKKYSAAIIGTGRIGFSLGFDKKREQPASHSFALAKNKRIKIVAACDTELDRLNAWQTYFPRATTFSSVDEMLAFGESNNNGEKSSNFDIIVVAVNEDSHLECALKAISAKPRLIILEKPVALNMEQAEKIRLASEENFVPILVNHERRFADDYKIARSWMDKIGTLQTVNARLFSGLRVYRKQDETTGEYSLLHDGTHLVDVVLYLLERNVGFAENGSQMQEGSALSNAKLVSVFCDGDKTCSGDKTCGDGKEYAANKTVRNLGVNFSHPACPDVNIYISGRSRFFGFEIEVLGTEGRIKIGNGFAQIERRQESKLYTGFYSLTPLKTVKFPKKTHYFSNMVQNAVDFLEGKCELRSTLETGIKTLKVLEQMKEFCYT